MTITQRQWNRLHPKVWDLSIHTVKEECRGKMSEIKFVVNDFNACLIIQICNECSDTSDEEIFKALDWLKEASYDDKFSDCCECIIIKNYDKRYFCSNCFREVEYYKCDYCDSDGMVRYRKCPECGGVKRIQL